jgi:hypothetical protein
VEQRDSTKWNIPSRSRTNRLEKIGQIFRLTSPFVCSFSHIAFAWCSCRLSPPWPASLPALLCWSEAFGGPTRAQGAPIPWLQTRSQRLRPSVAPSAQGVNRPSRRSATGPSRWPEGHLQREAHTGGRGGTRAQACELHCALPQASAGTPQRRGHPPTDLSHRGGASTHSWRPSWRIWGGALTHSCR